MPQDADPALAPRDAPPGRSPDIGALGGRRRRGMLQLVAGFVAAVTTALLALAVLILLGVEGNPVVGGFVRDRIVLALQERLDPGLTLSIDSVDLSRHASGTTVRMEGFRVADSEGRTLVKAPSGHVTLETASLLFLRLVPTEVVLDRLSVEVEIAENGSIRVAPSGGADILATPVAAPDDQSPPLERLRQIVGAAFAGLSATRDAVGGRLPSLGIEQASLAILDRRTGRRYDVRDISARLASSEDGSARARVDLKTGRTPWSAHLDISPRTAEGQGFSARTENLTLAELLSFSGAPAGVVDPRTPASLSLSARVDSNLRASAARAQVGFGVMSLFTDHAPATHVHIGRADLTLDWREGSDRIAVESLRARIGEADIALKGEAEPPRQAGEPWRIGLNGANLRAPGAAAGDKPVEIAAASVEISAWPELGRYHLTNASLAGPQANARMNAAVNFSAEGFPGLDIDLDARDTDARAVLRLWPVFVAPEVRGWLLDHFKGGLVDQLRLKLNWSEEIFAAAWEQKPIPDSSLSVAWNVSRATLQPVPGSPPIRDLSATGLATGRTARIDLANGVIDMGQGRRLAVPEGAFTMPDTSRAAPEARVRVRFSGGADALAELVATPGLKAHAPVPADAPAMKGGIEGEANIALRLAPKMGPGDVRVAVNANLRGMTIEKAIAGEKIEAGNFQLQVDRQNLLIKGEAKVFGAPASIELRGTGKGKPRAVLSMVVDEATRNRKGWGLGGFVSGPVALKVVSDFDGPDDGDMEVEADLARSKLEGLIPGWLKPAGQPARAKATLSATDGGGWQLNDIEFDAGAVSVRGAATLAKDGQLVKAALPVFKISQGDNARVDIDRAGGALRLNVRGNSIDARPFLKSLQTGAIDKSGAKDTEILLKTTVLSGFNAEVVSNADLKLTLRGSELRRFDLTGHFDRGPIATRLSVRQGAAPTLTVDSGDAGAFLRFLDMYNRMQGGHLILGATLGGGGQTGTILIRDFVLRNEPAMKRLVADASSQAIQGDSVRIDPAFVQRLSQNQDVRFTKMNVEFQRNASRLNLKDAVIWGPEIGGSMAGYLDYGRDRVELTGTFVPAYSLNNMFAQVPLFGPLLGGGQYEGLFAIRYSIIGRVSAPTLTVNPLTAIAPGFLRRLIDFRSAPGSGAPRPPPSGSDR
jgi:hypothetical protein